MSAARLAAHVEVTGMIRRVETFGGTAMVLRRGDRDFGTLLVVLAQRGEIKGIIERSPTREGAYAWHFHASEKIERKQSINDFVSARTRTDPDLWVLELDIPEAERFAAQIATEG